MAMSAAAPAAGAASSPAAASGGAGQNPFFFASNLYAEKIAATSTLLGTQTVPFFQAINPGNFMRGVRFIVRSSGGVGGSVTADNPWNVIQSLDLENVDGGEIIYPLPGYSHAISQRYFRPWLGDPFSRYDYVQSINPSFTLFLQPEIRHAAGVLANTDSRSLYKYNLTLNTAAQVATGLTTAPTVSVTSYLDAYAQPDSADLHGVANQPLPPGGNLQMKRRHQPLTMLQAGTDNIFQLGLTGNALRGVLAVVRDSAGARQDYFSDPIRWQLDNRNLGVFSPDMLFQWVSDFLAPYNIGARPAGVYPFLRFYDPGNMTGQGWLYTTDATKITWETATAAGAANMPGTADFISDEVYPIGAIPAELQEI